MLTTAISTLVGFCAGVFVGFMIMALCQIQKRGDDE